MSTPKIKTMSKMEMFYIDSTGAERKTGVGAIFATSREARRAFLRAKKFDVSSDEAAFLLDYYDRNGKLTDTVCLTREGFEAIFGKPALEEAYYLSVDLNYWGGNDE